MVDPKLGTKRVCEGCGAKFYDLNKTPAICPKCGHSYDPSAAVTSSQPVADIAPTAENENADEDTLADDEDAISLDTMVEDEAADDEEDGENIGDFDGEEALLDDNDEDDTLLDDDEDEEDSFLEEEDDD